MACLSIGEEGARDRLANDLGQLGLRLLEIDEARLLVTPLDAAELDEHLSANLEALEPGKRTVWGTIHCYRADGEA